MKRKPHNKTVFYFTVCVSYYDFSLEDILHSLSVGLHLWVLTAGVKVVDKYITTLILITSITTSHCVINHL